MKSIEAIKMFLNNNVDDVDLILSEDIAVDLVKELLNDQCQFIQSVKRIQSVFSEIEAAEDGVVSISRLITADGESIYFVFPLDERKINNKHLIIEEEVIGHVNIDLLDNIENKYVLRDLEKKSSVKEFINALF